MPKDFYTIADLESSKFKTMDFSGRWLDSFGCPEARGVWIIYGESFNGKSTFMAQVAKYLTGFVKSKVLINSLEEGRSESFRMNVRRANLDVVQDKILLGDRVPMDRLKDRLKSQRSPEVILIDSLQYTELDRETYHALKNQFPNKLFVFISQAEGKDPSGALGKHIRFDADVKIRVEGYKAFVQSRYGGGVPFIINEKRASSYWGEVK